MITGTSNGTEYTSVKYKTSDGFVHNTYTDAAIHAYKQQNTTNAGTYIEPVNNNGGYYTV